MSTLLLCDDHRVVRGALADLLSTFRGVSRVEQASSGEEVLALYPRLLPDVVLMDVRLPRMDGVTATEELLKAHPQARVLMLTGEAREDDRHRSLKAGARGYLSKDIDQAGLARDLSVVMDGGDLLSPRQRRALALERPGVNLSARELQVVHGMAAGRSNAEIGMSLWISQDTVKAHAKTLFAKVGAHDRAAAVAWAFRASILS